MSEIICQKCNRRMMKKKVKKIKCNICCLWYHKKCISLTNKEFNDLLNNQKKYGCMNCINECLPFNLYNSSENITNEESLSENVKLKPT